MPARQSLGLGRKILSQWDKNPDEIIGEIDIN